MPSPTARSCRICATGIALSLGVLSLALPVTASAQNYLGVDAMQWFLDEDQGDDYDALGVRGKLGRQLGAHVAVETHLGGSGSDGSGGERRELDYVYGVMVRADVPLSRYAALHGLIGFSNARISGRDPDGDSIRYSDNGISIGLGFDYAVTNAVSLNVDWVRYVDTSEMELSALSAGARFRF